MKVKCIDTSSGNVKLIPGKLYAPLKVDEYTYTIEDENGNIEVLSKKRFLRYNDEGEIIDKLFKE